MKKKSATHTTKHKGTSKHTSTAKHKAHEEHLAHEAHEAHLAHEGKVHAVAKPAKPKKPAKARSLAVGDALPVCSFEALAMSLRLAGQRVSDDDVAELWWLAGAGEDGAPIAEALDAAARFGLAGARPAGYHEIAPGTAFPSLADGLHCSILGLELPGPHAVVAVPGAWLSWGESWSPSDFPGAVIEEAWAVAW